MAAVLAAIPDVLEGIDLLDNLIQAASAVSTQIQAAKATGQPLDWTTITGAEATAENAVLAAIAAAKAAGK